MNKVIYILLFFTLIRCSLAQTKTEDVLLFEIQSFSNRGGGGMGQRFSSKNMFLIYQSGRIACKSLRYDPRGKEIKGNKSNCFQISKTKVNELIELAEQSDFQTANYSYFANGIDWGKSFSIIYFSKNETKKIYLGGGRSSSSITPIPTSLEKFLTSLGEINEDLKVKYELGKK